MVNAFKVIYISIISQSLHLKSTVVEYKGKIMEIFGESHNL